MCCKLDWIFCDDECYFVLVIEEYWIFVEEKGIKSEYEYLEVLERD